LGSGFVDCSHGRLPVPAPATAEILKGIPIRGSEIQMELVTPTGAAIVASLANQFGPLPAMSIQKTGYGAGKRKLESQPNLLRVIAGTLVADANSGHEVEDEVCLIETNIDDMNPEIYDYLMQKLFEDGALDVCWIPIHMKKNRPGTLVQVLCHADKRTRMAERLLAETTTAGIRYHKMRRQTLAREFVDIDTTYGTITAKKIIQKDGSFRLVPEYESCKEIALTRNIPLRTIYDVLSREFAEKS